MHTLTACQWDRLVAWNEARWPRLERLTVGRFGSIDFRTSVIMTLHRAKDGIRTFMVIQIRQIIISCILPLCPIDLGYGRKQLWRWWCHVRCEFACSRDVIHVRNHALGPRERAFVQSELSTNLLAMLIIMANPEVRVLLLRDQNQSETWNLPSLVLELIHFSHDVGCGYCQSNRVDRASAVNYLRHSTCSNIVRGGFHVILDIVSIRR
jgi:hypothetical protein